MPAKVECMGSTCGQTIVYPVLSSSNFPRRTFQGNKIFHGDLPNSGKPSGRQGKTKETKEWMEGGGNI